MSSQIPLDCEQHIHSQWLPHHAVIHDHNPIPMFPPFTGTPWQNFPQSTHGEILIRSHEISCEKENFSLVSRISWNFHEILCCTLKHIQNSKTFSWDLTDLMRISCENDKLSWDKWESHEANENLMRQIRISWYLSNRYPPISGKQHKTHSCGAISFWAQ